MRILAIKLRAIGDTVIWTSALNSLKRAMPEARIHVLTYASNRAVLEGHPSISVAHFLNTKSHLELIRTLWTLRAQRFDFLLGFHATTSLCRWAWLAGAQEMVLHHHSWPQTPRGSLKVPSAANLEDTISRDLRVIEALQIETRRQPTSIVVSESEGRSAEETIQEAIARVGGDSKLPRRMFLPGAAQHLRRYPKDLWWPLVLKAKREGKIQPVVICDPSLSKEWGLRELCASSGVPLLDQGSLREFIAQVSRGKFALANDSGPGHIAVALGLKTDFVFGPGCVGDWHPYDREENPVHRVKLDCRLQGPRDREEFQFCTVDECAHHSCMRRIQIGF